MLAAGWVAVGGTAGGRGAVGGCSEDTAHLQASERVVRGHVGEEASAVDDLGKREIDPGKKTKFTSVTRSGGFTLKGSQ